MLSPSGALASSSLGLGASSDSVVSPPILEASELIPRSAGAASVLGDEGEAGAAGSSAGLAAAADGASSIHPSAVLASAGESFLGEAGGDMVVEGGWWRLRCRNQKESNARAHQTLLPRSLFSQHRPPRATNTLSIQARADIILDPRPQNIRG